MPKISTSKPFSDSTERTSRGAETTAGGQWLVKVHDLDHAQVVESTDQRHHHRKHGQSDVEV